MKKKITILAAIFVVFAILGAWYNLTPGRYFGGDFWTLKDGAYTYWGSSVRQTGDSFDVDFGGSQFTAAISETETGCRVDFSDGWAVEMDSLSADIGIRIGGYSLIGDATYILTDMEAANLRFGRVVDEVREPFYDENGNEIGESFYRVTESGESVGWQEIWYDRPDMSTPEAEIIQLHEGMRFTSADFRQNLYVNEDGEFLMNAQDLTSLRWTDTEWYSRSSLAAFLVRIAGEEPTRRGEIGVVFLYAFIYLLGAAQFLWPEQMAFFGHRWQYRNEPELSDEGLFMMKLGAVIVMIMGIVLMFINYQ